MRSIKKYVFTIVCNTTNNTVPSANPTTAALNGFLRGIKIKAPATVDNTATTAVTISDADGDQIYSKSGVAAAGTNIEYQDSNHVPTQLPLTGIYTIAPVLSANQTTPRTVVVTLLVEQIL